MLAERLANRTLELVDAPSESRDEAALAAHVLAVLQDAGVPVRDAGDTCILAGATERADRPLVLLAGHLDTVPAQGNRPGSRDAGSVHGLGASDMKGGVAVMIELALARLQTRFDLGFVFFGREELPVIHGALTPLLGREPGLHGADLAIVMEPTSNAIHAGCLGNINAAWRFHGKAGHSARPWLGENAIHLAAKGVAALAEVPWTPVQFDGLEFVEAVSATIVEGGVASNVIPDLCTVTVNYRYPPGVSAEEAEARLHGWCDPYGKLEIVGNAPSGRVATGALVDELRAAGSLALEPKQAWTPVAEFDLVGVDAVNFGPGEPKFAHRRDEQIPIANLVRSYEVLERFTCG